MCTYYLQSNMTQSIACPTVQESMRPLSALRKTGFFISYFLSAKISEFMIYTNHIPICGITEIVDSYFIVICKRALQSSNFNRKAPTF